MTVKTLLKYILPYGLIKLRRKLLFRNFSRPKEDAIDSRREFHNERKSRINTAGRLQLKTSPRLDPENYSDLMTFLENRGLPPHHLSEGSIPESSLIYIKKQLAQNLNGGKTLVALHIGNFVGVSLAYMAGIITSQNINSKIVSIDPNLTHRGISNPQSHVASLIAACGLEKSVVMVAGYSQEKSISNDGVVFGGYDPQLEFERESACENCIDNLKVLEIRKFDIVLMDGNHEALYLRKEIQAVKEIMTNGGVLILDDVDQAWQEIQDVFSSLEAQDFEIVGTDGRVGLARIKKS